MLRQRSRSAIQNCLKPSVRPRGKELDLLLLAGCSCLLTILSHPGAEALQSASQVGAARSDIATQLSRSPVNSASAMHVTLPPERDKIKREDEEE